jgi:hypothetical protein
MNIEFATWILLRRAILHGVALQMLVFFVYLSYRTFEILNIEIFIYKAR